MTTSRPTSAVDRIADEYVDRSVALFPLAATQMGIAGFDHLMGDQSPAVYALADEVDRATLAALDTVQPQDDVDRVTIAAMRERLGLQVEIFAAREYRRDLNNIASPLQNMRDVFDIMPTATVADWENIASRLEGFGEAMDGYIACLVEGLEHDQLPARRQVGLGIEQARELADADTSFFTAFTAGAKAGAEALPTELTSRLAAGAEVARQAYARLADVLDQQLAPHAPEADGVGRERYQLWSRLFLGATIDLEETYEWGLAELDRIIAEQTEVAEALCGPGATVEQAVAALDADTSRTLHGTDALREWMQTTADQAIAELADTQFDIPEPVRRIECMIAPTQSGGIYYTGPSEDFSRPGRMWWSVPKGVTEFATWREKTTVYHEGVPGHHLQIGQTVYRRELLNRWRRLFCWSSGYGEGWALYAERLMADLGYLDDPGDRLGMLDAQRMRAARVVLDIGVHLGLPCPERWGGGTWDADKAWVFFKANVNMDEAFLRFEVDRYLGWPGQAPSYKVGQRLWEQARDAARAKAEAEGETFSLKDFHRRALDLGSLGLDVLREALA